MIASVLLSAALPLVPYPQRVAELGGSVRDPEVVCRTDASLKPEGYRLRVADGKAEIFSSTDAGAFYALRGSGTTDRLTSDIVRFGNGCSVGSSVARPVSGRTAGR